VTTHSLPLPSAAETSGAGLTVGAGVGMGRRSVVRSQMSFCTARPLAPPRLALEVGILLARTDIRLVRAQTQASASRKPRHRPIQ